MAREHYGAAELGRFREVQRLAYDCAEEVARGLVAGDTEREAARRLGELLARRGADGFFHQPFAWFGDRSGFYWYASRAAMRAPIAGLPEVAMAKQFFPTDRRLEPNMAAILDVAPMVDGYCADIGYAFSLGENGVLDQAKRELAWYRERILELVRDGAGMRRIYREVDAHLAERGYESCHFFYPNHVLGHKVGRLPLRRLPSVRIGGFDVRTLFYLGRQLLESKVPRLHRPPPLLNEDSDDRLEPGLWAIEPHIRREGIGAKWEEMLVVTENDAYWLDDDLPHVRSWRRAA